MTAFAKLLVFVTLVLGAGAAVFATAVYTQRPPWFLTPTPEAQKGQVLLTFEQLKKDIAAGGAAGIANSGLWGKGLAALKAAEDTHDKRSKAYAELLKLARDGDPVGFYVLDEDPATRRLDLAGRGTPVKGPNGKDLPGADTMLLPLEKSADQIANVLTPKIEKHQADQKTLGAEIDLFAARLDRQRKIQANLIDQAQYLAAVEINVAQLGTTIDNRVKQLRRRLAAFNPAPTPPPAGGPKTE